MELLVKVVTAIVLGALAAAVLALFFVMARHPGYAGAAECREAYLRARSAADSAIVDARAPVTGRTKVAAEVLTCGLLRRSGELQ